jgi:hypothetical protein
VAGRAPWRSEELDIVDLSKRVAFEPRYWEAPRESVGQLPKTSGADRALLACVSLGADIVVDAHALAGG